jgi:hypothetical protein
VVGEQAPARSDDTGELPRPPRQSHPSGAGWQEGRGHSSARCRRVPRAPPARDGSERSHQWRARGHPSSPAAPATR